MNFALALAILDKALCKNGHRLTKFFKVHLAIVALVHFLQGLIDILLVYFTLRERERGGGWWMYGSERAHREKAIMSTLIVTVNIIQKFYKKKKKTL